MGLSDAGQQFIIGKEGWNPRAYKDGAQWSIGYGTKAKSPDEVIDRDEGLRRLQAETGPLSDWINSNVTTPLTQQQHDSLVSFGYNTGALGKLKGDLNSGDFQKVADRMQTWNRAGGAVSPGLTGRRWDEGVMLLGGQPGTPQPGQTRRMALGGPQQMADDGSDLGSSLQQKPSLMGALSNPTTQAFLAGMAAKLLTGGWGSGVSQIGQGLGYGLESAGNQQQIQHQQEQEQKKMDQQQAIAEAHNKTQLQVAQIHSDTMKDVANTRAQARLSPQAQNVYNKVYAETMKNLNMQVITGQMDGATAHMIADGKAMESAGRFNPNLLPGAGAAAGTPPGPAGATGVNPAAKPAPTWDDVKAAPTFDKEIQDPRIRRQLRDKGFGAQVDAEMDARKIQKHPSEFGPGEIMSKLIEQLRPKGGFFPNAPWSGGVPGLGGTPPPT
jgi:GH24 family phage-related lysozyme (muramidase)